MGIAPLGAVSVVGGVFGPLGTMVPWGDSPREGRAAHGPLRPAVKIPLEHVRVCARFVFRLFRSLSALMSSLCFSQGLVYFLVL